MEKIAKFEKVSLEEFKKAVRINCDDGAKFDGFNEKPLDEVHEQIRLPKRGTKGSAGYDFASPFHFTLRPGESVFIPTGIRCKIADGWVLLMTPRSSLGMAYRMQIDNTICVIDSDYYGNEKNEGHIMLQVTNDTHDRRVMCVVAGERLAQGIFLPYGITEDDEADGTRTGGIGSTGR